MAPRLRGTRFVGQNASRDCFFGNGFGVQTKFKISCGRVLARCAIHSHERIVLFGDYDVDGVTSLALLAEMLRGYGAAPELFLPLRMEEGYGLSRESVERCLEQHRPQLLIAIDCGTASAGEIAELKNRGVDVVV